ncbi:hypothetical protein GCAAIG_06105 [Candidatus Electronema halotolerans]
MASRDLEIIKKIEKELNQNLRRVDKLGSKRFCYIADEQDQVTVLRLSEAGLANSNIYFHLFKELTNLKTFDLSFNQINDISFLKDMSYLQTLNLSLNQISDVSSLKELYHLKTLNLSSNQISDISFLKDIVHLQWLNLSFNKIKDISFLKNLIQLQTLNLWNNQIIRLPEWITELFPEIVCSDYFEVYKINVGNNPLTHPPPEIINQGREAIRAYFRSFEKSEAVKLHESKVLLVGDGKAGKTSLLKQFQGLDFDEHESQTHGINVQPLSGSEIAGFANPDQDCRLHFWDFGGQEIMHALHRFFMSNRSLYILVLDSRDDTGRCCWRWLRHIEKYGGQSPLIVAMNKIDANPSFNLEQKSINVRFSQIENRFFRISCKNKDGLPELVRSMAASVPKTPLYGFEISKAWLEIRKQLEAATGAQNYISQEQFIAICKEHGVEDETSRITLLKLFNDLGTLLFFEQIKLADIYVLDPHWVTVGVYKIINSARTKDGILHEEDLDFILKQEDIRCDEYDPAKEKCFTYTVQEQAYLVRIMEEFELCYRYDKHQHILPNQLPKEPEQEPKLTGEHLLGFVMEYDYLPSSFFSRLMVRLKEDIPDRRRQWRYGMYLENKQFGVEAIIAVSY